jgi:biopolymer transport protein ExbD
MKLKRQSRFHHEVSTSALNDIMFFLLLFFLIVATVANPQVIKLMLPNAENSDEFHANDPLTLTVRSDTTYQLSVGTSPAEEVEWENLEAAIRAKTQTQPDPSMVIRVDRNLGVQTLVDVMDLGMRMQMRMVLQTSTK